MKGLRLVTAQQPEELLVDIRQALTASGDAILPVPGAVSAVVPGEVLTLVPKPVAVVIETSGSTGVPKRVMLSRDALLSSAAASAATLGGPGQWLLALPGHYVAGVQVLVRSIVADTTPVLLPPGHFDPLVFAEFAERLSEPLRYTSLVPVQLARLLHVAASNPRVAAVLRRFTAILVGGQAVPPELLVRAAEMDVRVVRTYGSSETAGGCVYDGAPIGNTVVRVVDGQLEISGSVLGEAYLGDPDRTAARFITEHGVRWYRTGDLGEIDANGLVRVLGRADNVIISGGEKVSLDAVERVVQGVPGFAGALVVAADDPQWGQVPVVVRPVGPAGVGRREGPLEGALDGARAGGLTAEVELASMARVVVSALGRAARPARLIAVPTIPLLASGKPDLHTLRLLAAASMER